MNIPETYTGCSAKACARRVILLLSIVAGLTTLLEPALARDGRVAAAAGGAALGARWGYNRANYDNNFGYWYAPTPTQAAVAGAGTVSSLPSGYLDRLPDGAVPIVIFGKRYYFANGTDYSPVFYGGRTVYVVANP